MNKFIFNKYNYVMREFEDLIYEHVRLVPLGMVSTFGELARAVGNNVQVSYIVNILKKVQDITYIPTHRIVTGNGELSSSFVDGGKRGQKKLLRFEGVIVKKNKVDLSKYGFYFWWFKFDSKLEIIFLLIDWGADNGSR